MGDNRACRDFFSYISIVGNKELFDISVSKTPGVAALLIAISFIHLLLVEKIILLEICF